MRLWFHMKVLRHRVQHRVVHRVGHLELWVHNCSCGASWGEMRGIMR